MLCHFECFYCFRLLRQPEHVMTFLPSEMGTSGSLGGQPQLVVRSRFSPKSFEGILQRCISKYIIVIYYFHWVTCLVIIIEAGHLSLLIETKWMFINIKICTEKFQVSYDLKYLPMQAIPSNFGNSKQFGNWVGVF